MEAPKLDQHRLAAGLAVALTAGVVACGGSGKDEKAIRERVTTFDNGMAGKDVNRVCASVSKELKRRLTRTPSGARGPRTCEAALRLNFILSGNLFRNLAKAKVGDVQVDGDQARATISY